MTREEALEALSTISNRDVLEAVLKICSGARGIKSECDDLCQQRDAAQKEVVELKAVLASPAAVWTNILRGTIARPDALDHYEECKAKLEVAQKERDEARECLRKIAEFPRTYESRTRASVMQGIAYDFLQIKADKAVRYAESRKEPKA